MMIIGGLVFEEVFMTGRFLMAAAMMGAFGCDPPNDLARGERTAQIESPNGESLNGESLNGESLNGESLNGESLNGESLNGESLNGESLNGESLNGTFLSATTASGTQLSGSQLVGVQFDGVTVSGQTVRLKIESFSQGTGSNADVYYYGLSWKDSDGWKPTCANSAPSIATMGRWNFGQGVPGGGSWTVDWNFVTWSCVGSSITKCVELGYKPWKYQNGSIWLQPYHQACTRLLRADYCGNGQPYTVNGTLVDLYDGLNIQVDTDNWSFEAEWDATGARCMTGKTRSTVPVPCQSSKISNSCGSTGHFNNGTLLMSEIQ